MHFDEAEKYLNEADIRKLYTALGEGSIPYNPAKHDFLKLKITDAISDKITAALNRLETTIATNAAANSKLSKRVFWLNVVIAFAGIVAIIPAMSALFGNMF